MTRFYASGYVILYLLPFCKPNMPIYLLIFCNGLLAKTDIYFQDPMVLIASEVFECIYTFGEIVEFY